MTLPQRVALIFGGRSVEHEVSVQSARGVAPALAAAGFDCVPIGVCGDGRWLSTEQSSRVLVEGLPRVPAPTVAAAGHSTALLFEPGAARWVRGRQDGSTSPLAVDVVFPLVHGWGGEDGRLQGLLECAGFVYVGSGVLGSALAMDKIMAKTILEAAGLPVVPGVAVTRASYRQDPDAVHGRVRSSLGLPVFVKPANGGSSVGVSRATDGSSLATALEAALALDRRVLVEVAIDAREIECAVVGNDDVEASVLGEIEPSREFYDYAAKYLDGTSVLRIPAALPHETAERIRRQAVEAYRALDLAGFARVDFLLDRRSGAAYVNEVNTLPGFTPISMFPKLWEASGVGYPELIARLVRLAIDRSREESQRQSNWNGDVAGLR